MSRNVTIAGASYSAVPAIEVPATGGGTATFTDVSDTTAAASDVAQGTYFYTAAGVRTEGTSTGGGGGTITQDEDGYITISEGGSTPVLQVKSVTPSETAQTVTADTDYDGLSSVSVGAISSTYVGSGVTKKAAATYTPTTTAQTIAAGQYLNGAQTIAGSANLIPGNIKSGVNIFNVIGSYTGGGVALQTCEVTIASTIDFDFDVLYTSFDGSAMYYIWDTVTANGTVTCTGVLAGAALVIVPSIQYDPDYIYGPPEWTAHGDEETGEPPVPDSYYNFCVAVPTVDGTITIEELS